MGDWHEKIRDELRKLGVEWNGFLSDVKPRTSAPLRKLTPLKSPQPLQ